MNWDDMRVFLAVARAEGLTAAAPVLKMDPATLGRRVARLEASIGGALFVKSPQGYALTSLGERMRDYAVEAEAALAQAIEIGQAPASGLSGQVRIGAREADMAITVSPPAAGRLTVQRVTDYQLHLATRRDAVPIRSLDDLRGRPIVGYIPDMIFDKELDYLGNLGADGVQLASNSVAVQMQMVRHAGVGIVHDFALPAVPELTRVLVDEVNLSRSFYLVRHATDRQSARLTKFAAALVAGLQAEVTRLEEVARLTDAPFI